MGIIENVSDMRGAAGAERLSAGPEAKRGARLSSTRDMPATNLFGDPEIKKEARAHTMKKAASDGEWLVVAGWRHAKEQAEARDERADG